VQHSNVCGGTAESGEAESQEQAGNLEQAMRARDGGSPSQVDGCSRIFALYWGPHAISIRDKLHVEDNMDFFEAARERHSVRAFKTEAINEELLHRILEVINQAPSAGNLQSYEVYVVRDAQRKAALVTASRGQAFLQQAPVVLVFCANARRAEEKYGMRGTDLYAIQDAGIACTYAMLAAASLGLASVWVGAFSEAQVSQLLGLPEDQRPVSMLPLGHAAESPVGRRRRPLEDLIHEVK
jgi:nitroreductase